MFESNIRNHRPSRNDCLAKQPAYLYPNGMDVLTSLRRLLILSSGSVTMDTHALSPLSFDLFIRRDFMCAFYGSSSLSVPNSGSSEELNGIKVNGPIFPAESWTR